MKKKILVGFVFLVLLAIIVGVVWSNYKTDKNIQDMQNNIGNQVGIFQQSSGYIINATNRKISDMTLEEQQKLLDEVNALAQGIYNNSVVIQEQTKHHHHGGGSSPISGY